MLRAIAEALGTPLYVYDARRIRAQYGRLSAALAGIPHRIHYSVKANSALAVLGLLRELGAGADIVSGGELERALRAGFRAEGIVFSGVGKTRAELARAVAVRIGLLNVESRGELEALDTVAEECGRRVRLGMRVNPDVTTATHPYTRTGERAMKFGVPLDEVVPLAVWAAQRARLDVVGVGMHIGSQILDATRYREAAQRLAGVIRELGERGITTLTTVDVGGGIGISYGDGPGMDLSAYAEALGPLADTGLALALEPGRFLVGNAGVLLTRCLQRKHAGGKDFVVVDAGISDFLRASLYGVRHGIRVLEGGAGNGAAVGVTDVVGPICESGDFLGRDRELPAAQPGALLVVEDVGAYGFSMSSTYNSRPRPAEVLLDGDRWAVIRERERVEDLMRGEHDFAQLEWR